jgi:hypothetical protein
MRNNNDSDLTAGRESNPGARKYEAAFLTIQPQLLVMQSWMQFNSESCKGQQIQSYLDNKIRRKAATSPSYSSYSVGLVSFTTSFQCAQAPPPPSTTPSIFIFS